MNRTRRPGGGRPGKPIDEKKVRISYGVAPDVYDYLKTTTGRTQVSVLEEAVRRHRDGT